MNSKLIELINSLLDKIIEIGVEPNLNLPKIVVIGSQSSGKSSVLENIVGRDFLPRGSGIVTRCPLVLQLIHTKPDVDMEESHMEWGIFSHLSKKFYDFQEIQKEIKERTKKLMGNQVDISNKPIYLKIYSPKVITLTLVDLPGITKVPVGDQPDNIEDIVRAMILEYIEPENAIILAVSPANVDLANSDALKLAREVDPEGVRTVGVLTKIDLMDKGTNILDVLNGKSIPLKLGYVPVVNRSQNDIEKNKKIEFALESEAMFFTKNPVYRIYSNRCGTQYLSKKLSELLKTHIQKTIPQLKQRTNELLVVYRSQLAELGEALDDNSKSIKTLIHIIGEFANDFVDTIDGPSDDVNPNEPSSGAKIFYNFEEVYGNKVRSIDPFNVIPDVDIIMSLYNSAGVSPELFVSKQAFERLVKRSISSIEKPSIECVNSVYQELIGVLRMLLNQKTFERFRNLNKEFKDSVFQLINQLKSECESQIQQLFKRELNYINTAHPELISGEQAVDFIQKSDNFPEGNTTKNTGYGSISNSNGKRYNLNNGSMLEMTCTRPNGFSTSEIKSKSFFSPMVMRKFGSSSSNDTKENDQLETKDQNNLNITKLLITNYFDISKKSIMDSVIKIIMYDLVSGLKNQINEHLNLLVHGENTLDYLLDENEDVANERTRLKKLIEVLENADQVINKLK